MLFYINRNEQLTGEHEIHRENCVYLPEIENRLYLGYFYDPKQALLEAEKLYSKVDGCYWCCNEIHKM